MSVYYEKKKKIKEGKEKLRIRGASSSSEDDDEEERL